jgi:hypothetical protein
MLLEWRRDIRQVGLGGVMEKSPEGVLGHTQSRYEDRVLGNGVEIL